MWQSADPILDTYLGGNPSGGIYSSLNLGLFGYSHQRPVVMRDPDGEFVGIAIVGIGLFLLSDYANAPGIDEEPITMSTMDRVEAVGTVLGAGGLAKAGFKELGKAVFEETTGIPTDVGDIAKSIKKKIKTPYKRPSNATTKAQRASVQNKPCVDCGTTTSKQVADHKTPLVKEYYETGTIDKKKMHSLDAVQPQCPTCSAKQGADMSRYSKQQKTDLDL